jgi:pimeloyl-[acyl-carrier protein] synthase
MPMNTAAVPRDVDLMRDPKDHGIGFIDDINQLREHAPIYWSEKSHCWIVNRYHDVVQGFSGNLPLNNAGRNEFSLISIPREERSKRIPNIERFVQNWIVGVDPPQHTRLRRLMMQAFTRKIVEKIRPFARERIKLLLDMAEQQRDVEFNEGIARPIAGYVLFSLAGIPEQHFPALRDWSNAMVEGMTASAPPPDVLEKTDWCMAEMCKVVQAELKKRETDPRDDLITTLLNATEDGEKLTMEELLGAMLVIIVAGHDTTSNTMTLGVEALSRHPEAWKYMYEHPEKIGDCVNELMRYVAMSGGQPRIAGEDFEWNGNQIRKGDIVFLSIVGANRDPEVWKDPEKLDFTRDTTNSMVFAPGLHHCIGHLLAKMQLAEFFSALVNRFERVEVLDKELAWMPVGIFRGLYGMNVRFYPRGKSTP